MEVQEINSKEHIEKSQELLNDAVHGFVGGLKLREVNEEAVSELDGQIDGMITRLDEFGEILESVHNSTLTVTNQVLPKLMNVSQHISVVFDKIDCIQKYVDYVKEKVGSLEVKVNEIEKIEKKKKLSKYVPKFLKKKKSPTSQFLNFDPTQYDVSPSLLLESINELLLKQQQQKIQSFSEEEGNLSSKVERTEQTNEENAENEEGNLIELGGNTSITTKPLRTFEDDESSSIISNITGDGEGSIMMDDDDDDDEGRVLEDDDDEEEEGKVLIDGDDNDNDNDNDDDDEGGGLLMEGSDSDSDDGVVEVTGGDDDY